MNHGETSQYSDIHDHIDVLNHLNDGIGDPCAAQVSAKLAPSERTNVWLLESSENFGAEPPMGS